MNSVPRLAAERFALRPNAGRLAGCLPGPAGSPDDRGPNQVGPGRTVVHHQKTRIAVMSGPDTGLVLDVAGTSVR